MNVLNASLPATHDFFALFNLLAVASARAFGITIFFTAFSWGQIGSGILRMSFALCLAMPLVYGRMMDAQHVLSAIDAPLPLLIAKELLLGASLGFVCSLPFQALVAAGSLLDTTRGISTPLPSPTGESSALGVLFEVSALWLFAIMHGFWRLADALYASYGLWPLTSLAPNIDARALQFIALLLQHVTQTIVILAGPLLVLMLLCDVAVYVSAKLGKRMNIGSLAPNIKNLVLLTILPVFMGIFLRYVASDFEWFASLSNLMQKDGGNG